MLKYLHLLRKIIREGEPHEDRTGVGTLSVFGEQVSFNMKIGFPLLTTKKVTLRWVFEELRWFLSGSTQVADLQAEGVDIWDEWATPEQCAKFNREPGNLGPVYGNLWRDFGGWSELTQSSTGNGTDQIKELLFDIQNNPNSRRLIVTGWHPALQRRVALPPCHTLWQIKCHSNREMSLHLYARSIDAFLGLPYNIASYGLLLEMLCAVSGYTARKLVISFGDLHIYSNHLDAVATQLTRTPFDPPKLQIKVPDHGSPFENLLAIRYTDIDLVGYKHHPKIPAPVAV